MADFNYKSLDDLKCQRVYNLDRQMWWVVGLLKWDFFLPVSLYVFPQTQLVGIWRRPQQFINADQKTLSDIVTNN